MDPARIAALLRPFLPAPLADPQLDAVATYLDLLVRWNARTNLTAVRDPEHIVSRHIGESLFAAVHLFGGAPATATDAIDFGSGAGFPGIPLKIYANRLKLTLIESQGKKATFLREVIRALRLTNANVFAARAETFPGAADLVTFRAVEHFERALPIATSLLRLPSVSSGSSPDATPGAAPRLGLLIGASQVERARELLPAFSWQTPLPIPESEARILFIGSPVQS